MEEILSDNNSAKWRGKRPLNSRGKAARITTAVMQGSSLDTALPDLIASSSPKDQSFIRALCYGVLRDQRLLNHLAGQLLQTPLKSSQAEIMQLILVGLYQLRSMRVAPHAAVGETVEATGHLGQPRARGLVNAVLRRYQRESVTLEAGIPDEPALRYSHPRWMAQTLEKDWPEQWESILEANQSPGPMVLRVNTRQQSRDEYLSLLSEADIDAIAIKEVPTAIELVSSVDVQQLPGFAEGCVSVQDAAAQLAAGLLAPTEGMRILDACAAPGGKTAHLLESCASLDVTALDESGERLKRVAETLHRLQLDDLPTTLEAADAARPESWWDKKSYDRILLDAPCSGSGVIRRHPDIKWLRRSTDIAAMSEQQSRLLEALWPLLSPGGKLLYATCSVFKAEGQDVINAFMNKEKTASADHLDVEWGIPSGDGRIILPGPMDGFFYCLLSKQK